MTPGRDPEPAALRDPVGDPQAAYDELPDGVLVVSADERVHSLNAAGRRLLPRAPAEVDGLPVRQVLPLVTAAGQDWWSCVEAVARLPRSTRQPERSLFLPGPDGDVELTVTARWVRRDDQLLRTVVSFRDTQARVRGERSSADLVSTVAHELRSPLTSVKGFTATLLAKWDRFSDEQKQLMLQTVNADADRVTRLLSELLDVSRIDAGRLELRRQVVDLAAVLARAVAARVAAGEPPERFRISVGARLPELWLDPDKVEQIVSNLVENALRHGAGTVHLEVAPQPSGEAGAPGAILTVSDEGEGIPGEVLSRVFTRFWRAGQRPGTGLGLYIVKGLVEAHGGSISVGRSAATHGAEFRVTVPAGSPPWETGEH